MWTVLAWLTGSKIGRFFAGSFLFVASIGIALLKAFSAGQEKERAKQDRQSLKNIRERIKTDEEIRKMPSSDVRDNLRSDWLRDD